MVALKSLDEFRKAAPGFEVGDPAQLDREVGFQGPDIRGCDLARLIPGWKETGTLAEKVRKTLSWNKDQVRAVGACPFP